MLNDFHQAAEMGQDGTAHEDGDLLHDLDARVASLPGLLAFAHSLEEGQQGWDAQGGRHHREGSSRSVSHVLVHVVDIGPHGGDHGGQTSSLEGRRGERETKLIPHTEYSFGFSLHNLPSQS